MDTDEVPMGNWDDEQARETPVDGDRCVYCKVHTDESSEDVEYVPVGDSEALCTNCLEDHRRYKRSRTFMLYIHSAFYGTEYGETFNEGYENMVELIRERHGEDVPLRKAHRRNAES